MKRYISILLVAMMIFSSLPAMAANNANQIDLSETGNLSAAGDNGFNIDSDDVLKGTAIAVAIGGVVYLGHRFRQSRRKAELYETALRYEEQGEWGLAVGVYEELVAMDEDYEDAQYRLAEVRDEAEAEYIALGDEAVEEEDFEQAREYYQLAKRYAPDSFRAQNRLDELEDEMVAFYYNLGHTYQNQGDWERAYEEYQNAYNISRDYKDLTDRYHRAQAEVKDEVPLRAIMFIVNRTSETGLEGPFINELQNRLENMVTDEFYMIDLDNVRNVLDEQGQALSDSRDDALARDIGTIVGADEIIMGEIINLDDSSDEIELDFKLEIIAVDTGDVVKEISYTHTFAEEVSKANLSNNIAQAALAMVEEKF